MNVDGPPIEHRSPRLHAQGVAVSYSTLYRFARAHCAFGGPAITVRVADRRAASDRQPLSEESCCGR